MKATTKLAAAAVGVGVIVREVSRSRVLTPAGDADGGPSSRWRAVTVSKPAEEVAPGGHLPGPLAGLGDAVQVRITPAAGHKGTELAARLRDEEPGGAAGVAARLAGKDPRQVLRSALRESKQLLEVGEVLRVEPQPAGRRTRAPGGKLLEAVTRRRGGALR